MLTQAVRIPGLGQQCLGQTSSECWGPRAQTDLCGRGRRVPRACAGGCWAESKEEVGDWSVEEEHFQEGGIHSIKRCGNPLRKEMKYAWIWELGSYWWAGEGSLKDEVGWGTNVRPGGGNTMHRQFFPEAWLWNNRREKMVTRGIRLRECFRDGKFWK